MASRLQFILEAVLAKTVRLWIHASAPVVLLEMMPKAAALMRMLILSQLPALLWQLILQPVMPQELMPSLPQALLPVLLRRVMLPHVLPTRSLLLVLLS
jgi:hypothetical protein